MHDQTSDAPERTAYMRHPFSAKRRDVVADQAPASEAWIFCATSFGTHGFHISG